LPILIVLDSLEVPNIKNVIKSIKVLDTYVFHPVKYILSLKEICKKAGVQLYEQTDINFMKKENESLYYH